MPQKYRSSPMPLSDEEFERRLRLEERMQQGILLGDGAGGGQAAEYEAMRAMPVYNSGSASADMPQAAPVTPRRSEGISVADIPRKKDDDDEDEELEELKKEDFEIAPVPEIPEFNTPNWSDFMPGGARQGQRQQGAGHPDTPGTWRVNGADHPPLSDEEFERRREEEEFGNFPSPWDAEGPVEIKRPWEIPKHPHKIEEIRHPAPYSDEPMLKEALRHTYYEWPDENDNAAHVVGYLPLAMERGNGRDSAHFYNKMPELTGELTDVAAKKNVHVTAENRGENQGNFVLARQEQKGNTYKSESVVPGALDSMGVDYIRASGPPRSPIAPDNPVLRAPSAFGRPVIGLPNSYTIPEALEATVKNAPESAMKFLKDIWTVVSNPIEPIGNVGNLVSGIGAKMRINDNQENRPYADALQKTIRDRYGSFENIKRTVAEDPVGILADVGTAATGAGAVAGTLAKTVKTTGKLQGVAAKTLGKGSAAGGFESRTALLGDKLSNTQKLFSDVAGTVDPIAAPAAHLSRELQKLNLPSSPFLEKAGKVSSGIVSPMRKLNSAGQIVSTGSSIVKEKQKKQGH